MDNEKNQIDQGILIYDATCSFCSGLASRLENSYGVTILPNDSKKLPSFINKSTVKRDVHFIRRRRKMTATYTGVDAAIEIVATKHPLIAGTCRFPIVRQVLGALYFVVKKSRKYL